MHKIRVAKFKERGDAMRSGGHVWVMKVCCRKKTIKKQPRSKQRQRRNSINPHSTDQSAYDTSIRNRYIGITHDLISAQIWCEQSKHCIEPMSLTSEASSLVVEVS